MGRHGLISSLKPLFPILLICSLVLGAGSWLLCDFGLCTLNPSVLISKAGIYNCCCTGVPGRRLWSAHFFPFQDWERLGWRATVEGHSQGGLFLWSPSLVGKELRLFLSPCLAATGKKLSRKTFFFCSACESVETGLLPSHAEAQQGFDLI